MGPDLISIWVVIPIKLLLREERFHRLDSLLSGISSSRRRGNIIRPLGVVGRGGVILGKRGGMLIIIIITIRAG